MLPVPAGALLRRKHVRKAEAREANILVVEIGHVGAGKVLAVHPDIDQNASRASQAPGGFEHVLRCALYHPNESGSGTEEIRARSCVTWPLEKLSCRARGSIDTSSWFELQIAHRNELLQVGHEAALARDSGSA